MKTSTFKYITAILVVWFFTQTEAALAQRKLKQMDPQKEEEAKKEEPSSMSSFTDRLTYGGNFWMGFSNTSSQIYLQPLVGYKINDDFIAGTGFTYIYWKQSYQYYTSTGTATASIEDNIFGLNFFGRHNIIDQIFAHAEYQPMNFTSYNSYYESKRIWTNALYLGGGYSQSVGKGPGAYILVLYDVLWQEPSSDPKSFAKSFYPTPWNIRMGFMF